MRTYGPTLGIVVMDDDEAREETSVELAARDGIPPWRMNDPSFWPVPFRTAVAHGAHIDGLLAATRGAVDGITNAVSRLDRQTDMIIGDCGFMWAATDHLTARSTPTLLSGLDLLDLALGMSNRSVGIISYDAAALDSLLSNHVQRERIRIVGLNDMSQWKAVGSAGYMKRTDWSIDGLVEQLMDRLSEAVCEGRTFDGVAVLILECTMLPDFRRAIRTVTNLPILDLITFTEAALK